LNEKWVFVGTADDLGREEIFTDLIQLKTGNEIIPNVYIEYRDHYDIPNGWKYHDSILKDARIKITVEVLSPPPGESVPIATTRDE
jgi:hypothetical protein